MTILIAQMTVVRRKETRASGDKIDWWEDGVWTASTQFNVGFGMGVFRGVLDMSYART